MNFVKLILTRFFLGKTRHLFELRKLLRCGCCVK